jgi:hypothetical protein
MNRIAGVVVSLLALSTVNRGFEPRSGQTKDYLIGICCFSAKPKSLRSKNKDWLAIPQMNSSIQDVHAAGYNADIDENAYNAKYNTRNVSAIGNMIY